MAAWVPAVTTPGLMVRAGPSGALVRSTARSNSGSKKTVVALYALVPTFGHMGSTPLFVAAFCIILSMYGGGFATIPAYLRDIFGTYQVGAIHGRLLTAWSVAGVLGPQLINQLRQSQIDSGVPKAQAYSLTMYIMCGLLLIGFICNFAMSAVKEKYHYKGSLEPTGSKAS